MNQNIVGYLREGKRRGFSIQLLKKKLLEGGFSEMAVDEAIAFVEGDSAKISFRTGDMFKQPPVSSTPTMVKPNVPQTTLGTFGTVNNNFGMRPEQPKEEAGKNQIAKKASTGMKWMKISGICGAVLLVLSIVLGILQLASPDLVLSITSSLTSSAIIAVVFLIVFFVYYFGFVKLGSHTDEKLLRIGSWLIIIPFFLYLIVAIVAGILVPQQYATALTQGDNSSLKTVLVIVAITWVSLLMINILGQLFFSIGLMKAGKQTKFAKITGILNLIVLISAIAFTVGIILIIYTLLNLFSNSNGQFGLAALAGLGGTAYVAFYSLISLYILKIVTFIFEIVTLFKASKQFE